MDTNREAAQQPQCRQLEGSGAEHSPGLLSSLGETQRSQLHRGTQLVLLKLKLFQAIGKKQQQILATLAAPQSVQVLLWLCNLWSMRGECCCWHSGAACEQCQVSSCRACTCELPTSCTALCQKQPQLSSPLKMTQKAVPERSERDVPNPSGDISAPGCHCLFVESQKQNTELK